MNKETKKFIEKHVDLLDSDPVEFFYQTWLDYTLQRSDIAYMSTLLSEAGIKDVEESRELALLKALNTQIKEFWFATGGVSAMSVYDFIQGYMDNCVGYDENYVLLFIQKHAQCWDQYIELYREDNMTIIVGK